jgi:hypothetical protein
MELPMPFEEIVIGDSGNSDEPVSDLSYQLESNNYIDEEAEVYIGYYQITGLTGELIMDYINQSLYHIVDIYSDGYSKVRIEAEIILEDEFLTIEYTGENNEMGYDIADHITIDVATSDVVTTDSFIGDWDKFAQIFVERSGHRYDEQEGIRVFITEEEVVFTFVPLDDMAERVYVNFTMDEMYSLFDFNFEIPAS